MTRPGERQLRIDPAASLRLAERFGWTEAVARSGRVRRFVEALTGMVVVGFGIELATLRA